MSPDIEKRLSELLNRGKILLTRIKIYEGEPNYWCNENDIPDFQAWLASTVNIINVATTPDSFFQKECNRLVSHDDLKRGVPTHIVRTYLEIGSVSAKRHARESGHPEKPEKCWIPVCTGMTISDAMRQKVILR